MSGSAKEPEANYQIQSSQLLVKALKLEGLSLYGEIKSHNEISGTQTLSVESLVSGSNTLSNLEITLSGNERAHQFSLKTNGSPVSGKLSVNGGWDSKQWQGTLSNASFQTPLGQWLLEKKLTVSVNKNYMANLSGQCWRSDASSLCIEPASISRQSGNLSAQLSQLNTKTLSFLFPDDIQWQSILSATGLLSWQEASTKASFTVSSTPGILKAGEVSFEYDRLKLDSVFDTDTLKNNLEFHSETLGNANVDLAIHDMKTQRKLSGQLLINKLQPGFLAPFFQRISTINGSISANTRFGGTLEKPLLFGELSLNEGNLETKADLVSINQLHSKLTINGDKGEISGSMLVGDGQLKLGGFLNWSQLPATGQITVKGENLYVRYPGLLSLKMSPDLQFLMGNDKKLTGQIDIPWARIDIKELPENAVSISEDVVIVTPDAKTGSETGSDEGIDLNVRIILGTDIQLDAYGLRTDLAGKLTTIKQPGKTLEAQGRILLKQGRYHYLGQDLLIKEGTIIFSGPVSRPFLVINAIRNPDSIEDNVTVGIKVSGTPGRPDWVVYSNPAMSQQEQLSYLLRGRGLEDGDDSAIQSLLIGVGVSQLGGVASSVGEAFGLTDVALDTEGSGDDTQITIGGNIAPGLRLQYGAGYFYCHCRNKNTL